MLVTCLIGLGANLGDRNATLAWAVEQLGCRVGTVRAGSQIFSTRPAGGPPGQDVYHNAVAACDTALEPEAVLRELLAIEAQAGRTRSERWGPRVLDLDLLLFGDRQVNLLHLQVPHPRLAYRGFVLVPASQVAPHWIHPLLGSSLGELRERLRRRPIVLSVEGPEAGAAVEAIGRRLAELQRVAPHAEEPVEVLTSGTVWTGGTAPHLVIRVESADRGEPAGVATVSAGNRDLLPMLCLRGLPLSAVVDEAVAAWQAIQDAEKMIPVANLFPQSSAADSSPSHSSPSDCGGSP